MSEFKQYKRKAIAELRKVTEAECNGCIRSNISVSVTDSDNGSPKIGDMIARNPENHNDQWLVAEDYFAANFKQLSQTLKSTNMSFGEALIAIQNGLKVARSGWNGKGMWIALGLGAPSLAADQFWNKHSRQHAIENGGSATIDPYIIMKTASGSICMGWLASQADMLSNDWEIL